MSDQQDLIVKVMTGIGLIYLLFISTQQGFICKCHDSLNLYKRQHNVLNCFGRILGSHELCFEVNHIEYDVIVQISALQDGVCERLRVRACAVEIKPGVLRVSLMYAYGLTYKMAPFIASKGLFNTVYRQDVTIHLISSPQ